MRRTLAHVPSSSGVATAASVLLPRLFEGDAYPPSTACTSRTIAAHFSGDWHKNVIFSSFEIFLEFTTMILKTRLLVDEFAIV
jgi:hypothetical protein